MLAMSECKCIHVYIECQNMLPIYSARRLISIQPDFLIQKSELEEKDSKAHVGIASQHVLSQLSL
jgi:hypothetical protein